MATLSLRVGQTERTKTVPNTKLNNVAALVLAATDGPVNGTQEEQLDHLLKICCQEMVRIANNRKRHQFLQELEESMALVNLDGETENPTP